MRDIKFRAWDKEQNVMRVVTDLNFLTESIETKAIEGTSEMWEVYDPIFFKGSYELMQYTGLKDKNGVEIYEGDYLIGKQYATTSLDMPFEIKGVVKYSKCDTMFYLENENKSHVKFRQSIGNSIYGFEVIGNIYENADLLEEK